MTTKILVVSSNPICCRGLSAALEQENDLEVVAEAYSGEEALQKLRESDIDLVLMEATLSDMNGAEVTSKIKETYLQVKVLALSIIDHSECVLDMLREGASGCLMKYFTIEELHVAIRKVISDKTYLCSATSQLLISKYQQESDQRNKEKLISILTDREKDVLKLLSLGNTNAKIGQILGISTKTAETHRRNIIIKLKIDSVAEMTRFAIKNGLIS